MLKYAIQGVILFRNRTLSRGVVQMARTSALGAEGREFKSHHPDLMFTVYILQSQKTKSFYTGFTSDLQRRLRFHNMGLSTWTRRGIPWKLVYSEKFNSKKEAIKRENFLKKQKNRNFYEKLISSL